MLSGSGCPMKMFHINFMHFFFYIFSRGCTKDIVEDTIANFEELIESIRDMLLYSPRGGGGGDG